MAVAESFDNMISDLPYRPGRSVEDAVAELRRCSGTQFDPDIVEAFDAWAPFRVTRRTSEAALPMPELVLTVG